MLLRRDLYVLFSLIFSCCSCKSTLKDHDFPLGVTVNQFVQANVNYNVIFDTVYLNHGYAQLIPRVKEGETLDTVIRVSPFTFDNKKCVLILRVKNNLIVEYDIIHNEYFKWPLPLYVRKNTLDIVSDYDSFLNNKSSSKQDFSLFAKTAITKFGLPQSISQNGDTMLVWVEKGIVLSGFNDFTTTVLSFSNPGHSISWKNLWQFCPPIADKIALSYELNSYKDELLNKISIKDTVIADHQVEGLTTSFAEKKVWGLPGCLFATFNKENRLERYCWEFETVGFSMRNVFFDLDSKMAEKAKELHPKYSRHDDENSILLQWSNEEETIYAWYGKRYNIIEIGKAPNSYMKIFMQ